MKRRIFNIGLILLVFFSIVIGIAAPKAHAQAQNLTNDDIKNSTLTWINRATIEFKAGSVKLYFFSSDINKGTVGDNNNDYFVQNYNGCYGKISFSDGTSSTAKLDMDFKAPGATGDVPCQGTDPNSIQKETANPDENRNIAYELTSDGATIRRVDGYAGWSFNKDGTDPTLFLRVSDDSDVECQDRIKVTADGKEYRLYELRKSGDHDAPPEIGAPGCKYNTGWGTKTGAGVLSGEPYRLGGSGGNAGTTPDSIPIANGDAGTSDDGPSCESSGFTLAWVFCPIITGLAETSDAIYNGVVEPMLKSDTINASPTKPDGTPNPIYDVWSQFRVYANILLVIALLVVVFGQAIGGGVVDAYTAKKVLPRVLLAAILINLSIYIVSFALDITNIIGAGLQQIIIFPFSQAGVFSVDIGAGLAPLTLGAIGGVIAVLWVGGGAILPLFALFVLLPAFFALLSVMVTLILRKALIYFLIFVSPIAFAAFVLPNTEKLFKMWWNYLYKALLVYVVIEVIFAMSKVMSATITLPMDNNGIVGALNALAGILILLMPLFLMPFAFKMTGGALGSLYGTLSGLSKKGVEGIKGNANDPTSLRNRTKRRGGENMVKRRDQFARSNMDSGSKFRRGIGKMSNFGDVNGKAAAINEEAQKRMQQTSGFGDDTYTRARTSLPLFVKRGEDGKAAGETTERSEALQDANGNLQRVTNKNGEAMRTSMNGQKRYTDYQYNKSKNLYKSQGELQESVNYEAKKALTSGDSDTLYDKNMSKWIKQEGLSPQQSAGIYAGVTFTRQNERLERKHGTTKVNDKTGDVEIVKASQNKEATKFNEQTGDLQQLGGREALVEEILQVKGNWAVSQGRDSTVKDLATIKKDYADEIGVLSAIEDGTGEGAALKPREKKRLELMRRQLTQIQNMEDNWVADPSRTATTAGGAVDDEGTPGYSGLSGAPEAVQQAARDMALRTATVDVGGVSREVKVRQRYDAKGNMTTEKTRARDSKGNLVSVDVPPPPPPKGKTFNNSTGKWEF